MQGLLGPETVGIWWRGSRSVREWGEGAEKLTLTEMESEEWEEPKGAPVAV